MFTLCVLCACCACKLSKTKEIFISIHTVNKHNTYAHDAKKRTKNEWNRQPFCHTDNDVGDSDEDDDGRR